MSKRLFRSIAIGYWSFVATVTALAVFTILTSCRPICGADVKVPCQQSW